MTDERNVTMTVLNFSTARWRKSSRSTSTSNCVEVSFTGPAVGIRDSKNTVGPLLAFPTPTWHAFLRTTDPR